MSKIGNRLKKTALLTICVFYCLPATYAFAGMPSALPEDIATVFRMHEEPRQRFQAISFFIVGILVSTVLIQFFWNSLAKDFIRIPRLNFFRAFVIVVMWGTLFVIILTMISGARELMTPGAWKKNGITYSLDKADSGKTDVEKPSDPSENLNGE